MLVTIERRANSDIILIVRSTGVLIYTIHSPNQKPIKLFGTNVEQFKVFALDVKSGIYPNLTCISSGIVDNVRLMLHYNPELRPNLYELPKVKSHTVSCV